MQSILTFQAETITKKIHWSKFREQLIMRFPCLADASKSQPRSNVDVGAESCKSQRTRNDREARLMSTSYFDSMAA